MGCGSVGGGASLNDNAGYIGPGDQAKAREIEALELRVAELMEAVAARDAFLAVASHELRNPMTPILAQVQRLRRISEGSGDPGYEIARGLGRLERLVEHYVRRATALLEVSRMTTGKLTLSAEPVDLASELREIVEAFRPAALYAGSSMEVDAPDALPVRLDRLAMEQILDNLISDAVKYGGGRPIDIRLRAEGEWAVIEVQDRGVGITLSDQARIFDRFERAVAQGSTIGGFGVGLWVVGQLVEAMGARIVVNSVPDKGTTFTLQLPLSGTKQT
jgi:two-component system, OmpR family, sensor kinase